MSKYCIIFIGEINDTFQLDSVKLNLKRHFKLSEIQTQYIFSGKEVTLKKNMSQESALQFAMRLDEMGAVSYIEMMAPNIHLPEGISQDRRIKNRREKFERRNQARAGLSAERRIHSDRRKHD